MQTNSGLLPSFCAPIITNGLVLAKRSERSFVVFAKSYIKFKYTTSNMDHEKLVDNTFAAKQNGFNSFNQRRLIDKFNYLVRSESDFMIG